MQHGTYDAQVHSPATRWAETPRSEAHALKRNSARERDQGRFARAAHNLGEALELARSVGDRLLEAEIYRERGDLRLREGDAIGARTDWTEALQGFRSSGMSWEAEGVRARLSTLTRRTMA